MSVVLSHVVGGHLLRQLQETNTVSVLAFLLLEGNCLALFLFLEHSGNLARMPSRVPVPLPVRAQSPLDSSRPFGIFSFPWCLSGVGVSHYLRDLFAF